MFVLNLYYEVNFKNGALPIIWVEFYAVFKRLFLSCSVKNYRPIFVYRICVFCKYRRMCEIKLAHTYCIHIFAINIYIHITTLSPAWSPFLQSTKTIHLTCKLNCCQTKVKFITKSAQKRKESRAVYIVLYNKCSTMRTKGRRECGKCSVLVSNRGGRGIFVVWVLRQNVASHNVYVT
jgi:hypothetical protein